MNTLAHLRSGCSKGLSFHLKEMRPLTGDQKQACFLRGPYSTINALLISQEFIVQWMGEERRFSLPAQSLGLQGNLWSPGAWRSLEMREEPGVGHNLFLRL